MVPRVADGGRQIRFEEFVVDLSARTVERRGEAISLEPQVFDVLAVLIEHRDRVVSKLELFDRVWGDRFVSPATLTSRIRDLRAALGDSGRSQHVVKTAHGRGFRFVAPVVAAGDEPTAASSGDSGLIGRAAELAELDTRLHTERLVTLVGPGGVGKTRLMRHLATRHGAPVCELVDVRSGDAVVRAMSSAVGGSERPDLEPIDAIVDTLSSRGTSMVAVDNCEHVVGAVTTMVGELLGRCPDLRIVATSRQPLQLADESVVRLGGLDTEAAASLFQGRAARHGVDLPSNRTAEIERVCARLDGLPLAIELAASKVRAIPVDELARLLDERFAVLTTDAHDVSDHHRSLDTTIRWSVELLTDAQRTLLSQLSVFVGTFDLDAVDAVCRPLDEGGSVLADLVALVDVSLVEFDAERGRYYLLESIRMFAEGLDRPSQTVDRFRDHVLDSVADAGDLDLVDLEHDVLRIRDDWPAVRAIAATAIADGDTATVHRLVAAVARFAEQTFAFEVIDWAEAAGEPVPEPTRVAHALLLTHRGDFERAAAVLERVGDDGGPLETLARMWHSYFIGDLATADEMIEHLRRTQTGTGSYEEIVAAVASQFLDRGAHRPFDAATVARLDELARSDDAVVRTGAELCAALRLDWDEDQEEAVERLTAVIDTSRALGLSFLASGASTARSLALAADPAGQTSVRVLRATLRSYATAGSWQFALADFGSTALALVRNGAARDAAELLGAREASGFIGDSSADVARTARSEAVARLGDRAFDEATRQGRARDPATATRLAIGVLDRLMTLDSDKS